MAWFDMHINLQYQVFVLSRVGGGGGVGVVAGTENKAELDLELSLSIILFITAKQLDSSQF